MKLPKATVKNGFLLMIVSRVNSKLLANVSKISLVWLGDYINKESHTIFHQFLFQNLYICLEIGCQLL